MSDIYPVAGGKIYIGPAKSTSASDFVEADFTTGSPTYVEIDGWETMGAIGDTSNLITTQLINRNRDLKQKGTRNAGSMQNNFAIVQGDSGQDALIAAEKTNDNYQFKIIFDDVPNGGTNGTTKYFLALNNGASEQGGNANTARMLQATLEVNSNIVTVDAA